MIVYKNRNLQFLAVRKYIGIRFAGKQTFFKELLSVIIIGIAVITIAKNEKQT